MTPEETENRADDRTHKSHNSQNTVADEGPEIRVITDGAETKAMLDELSTAPYIGLEQLISGAECEEGFRREGWGPEHR